MEETEKHYQLKAKEFVNLLFDKGFLAENLSRESINWLENYIAYVLQAYTDLAIKTVELTKEARTISSSRYDG